MSSAMVILFIHYGKTHVNSIIKSTIMDLLYVSNGSIGFNGMTCRKKLRLTH